MKYIFVSGRRFITFAPIMSNHPKSPIIDLQQQQLLLRMEYEYEKEEFKRQTETMGVARKVKRGLCFTTAIIQRNLRLSEAYNTNVRFLLSSKIIMS